MTRECLVIIDKYGFGVTVLTKSNRVLRDLELLKSINEKAKAVVQMTLTTYDEALCKILEPNVCTTKERFKTLQIMRDNGIPTVVWLSPLLPFINDTEENLRGILSYCFEAGVKGILCFGIGVTLRKGDREYFYKNLDDHFPCLREKYHRKYGYSYQITSDNNNALMEIFHSECKANGVISDIKDVFKYLNEFPEVEYDQIKLF